MWPECLSPVLINRYSTGFTLTTQTVIKKYNGTFVYELKKSRVLIISAVLLSAIVSMNCNVTSINKTKDIVCNNFDIYIDIFERWRMIDYNLLIIAFASSAIKRNYISPTPSSWSIPSVYKCKVFQSHVSGCSRPMGWCQRYALTYSIKPIYCGYTLRAGYVTTLIISIWRWYGTATPQVINYNMKTVS